MTRLFLATLLLVAALPRIGLAGDPKAAQDGIDAARRDLEEGRWVEAQDSLRKAEQQLEGLDDAVAGPKRQEIVKLRAASEVKQLSAQWTGLSAEAGQEQEGWESEQPLTFEEWTRKSDSEFMPRSAGMYEAMRRFLTRARQPLEAHAADSEVKRIVAEATAARDKAAAAYVAGLEKLMKEASARTKERPKDLLLTTRYLADKVQSRLPAGELREKGLAPVRALLKQIEGEMQGATEATADLKRRCQEAAVAAWPGMLDELSGCYELTDPAACAKDIGSWKGRLVRLKDLDCPARFADEAYDLVAVVARAPVVLSWDEGLREALKAMVAATGLEQEAMEDVVAVVEDTCQARQYTFSGETRVVGETFDAPRCRIVAFKAGPFAASLKSGTCNLSAVAGLPAIEVKARGEVPSGSGGGLKVVLGVLVVLIGLVALVGGGWWLHQQKPTPAPAPEASDDAPPEE